MQKNIEAALKANAWPFQEAQRIVENIGNKVPSKGYVLFETGYGPSGLPHIGTFGEVARSVMVQKAFEYLTDIPTKLIAFSDDMDGLRKVPDNIPQPEMVRANIGRPLTFIPDPFGTDKSFGDHMNNRLRAFLDHFGFEYEFFSATACYKAGMFDTMLLKALEKFDEIMEVMLPTLGEERQQTYSPFFPVCPETGMVLQVPVTSRNLEKGTITYVNSKGVEVETPVTGGHCKLQWKPDFAMRWAALDVDFEMFGKEHGPSAPLYSSICKILGGKPPVQFVYELFLDEKGQKISKSKGNGLTIDEWLTYAPTESLAYYMYQSPRKAKRLYFDVIPRHMDDYLTYISKFQSETDAQKLLENPVWHIHKGNPPKPENEEISFSLLLNLASVCNPENADTVWAFVARYKENIDKEHHKMLYKMCDYAVRYYNDFVKPTKQYKTPDANDINALTQVKDYLATCDNTNTTEEIQNKIYEIGKNSGIELKDFFKSMYQILLGQNEGPRLGSFIKLYGIENTKNLIENVLK